MKNFPVIEHIDDLLPHIQGKDTIRVSKEPNGTTVVCYMIDDGNVFDNIYARECRGIVFDNNGKIICRPLHKFFNINERPETQENKIASNQHQIERTMEKLDGSMLTPVFYNNQMLWKTKKKFESDVAVHAAKYAATQQNITDFFYDIKDEYTPIFEYTTPSHRIVIHYKEPSLTLLHVRHLKTGEYADLHSKEWQALIQKHNISLVNEIDGFSFAKFQKQEENLKNMQKKQPAISGLINHLQGVKEFEGVVIQFINGEMVKLKSQWYLDLHHVMTFLRERDVAEFVLDEKIDDIKSNLVGQGAKTDAIDSIQKKVADELTSIANHVDEQHSKVKDLSRKEAAGLLNKDPYFGLIMDKYSGKEPNYKEYFRKNKLKNYSLTSINVIEDNLMVKNKAVENEDAASAEKIVAKKITP